MDQNGLRQKARELIQAGALPARAADRTWGGPGSGLGCAVCGQPLIADESELELEFFPEGGSADCATHHLHLQCFDAWELERQHGSSPSHRASAVNDGTIGDREANNPYGREP